MASELAADSTTPIDRSGDPTVAALLVALPAVIVFVIGLLGSSPDLTGDVALYHELSGRVLRGEIPYVDFELEYPVLSLAPMLLPRLLLTGADPDLAAYQVAFVVVNAMLTAAIALVVGRFALAARRRPQRALAVLALLVALSAHLVAWRYDVTPALLSGLALAFLAGNRPVLAGTMAGLATATKLYPAVLIAIGVIWLLAGRRGRDAVDFGAAATAATVIAFVPLALVDTSAWLQFLGFQMGRGLQLESVPAGLLALGSGQGWTPVGIEFAYKSYQVTTPLTSVLLNAQLVVAVVAQLALAAAMWLHLRRGTHAHDSASCLVGYSVAAVLAFMITNKVLSPQYLVWLLPLVPLVPGASVAALVAIAAALSVVIFPAMYPALIGLDPGAILLLNLRNLALVGALAAVLILHPPALRPWRHRADSPARA